MYIRVLSQDTHGKSPSTPPSEKSNSWSRLSNRDLSESQYDLNGRGEVGGEGWVMELFLLVNLDLIKFYI